MGRVRGRGGNVSMHNRGSMKNVPSGWGNYSLTFMGPHREHYYHELVNKLQDADIDTREVTSHVRAHVFT